MTTQPATGNADQIAAWNDRSGPRWARLQPRIDALFAPITQALLTVADPRPGQRLLDVGCGCGDTVLALARAVGPTGGVLGVDVSAPMLEVAERRIASEGLSQARVAAADAAAYPFAAAGLDGAVSRFGVMFFDDPVAAFRHLRGALVPGGRLAFCCWRPMAENPWFREPVEAVLPLLGPQPPVDPDAPGPFGLARPGRAVAILDAAGWDDVAAEPHAVTLHLGDPGGHVAAADFVCEMVGMVQRLLGEAAPAVQAAGRAAVAERLRAGEGPEGIRFGASVWLVSARA